MPRTTTARAKDVLADNLPGTVRVVLTVYLGSGRGLGYRPVPKRHVRVVVDTVEQAEQVWSAVAGAIEAVAAKWPKVGDGIQVGFGIDAKLDGD